MSNWVQDLQNKIPDFAKDIKLNLDAVVNRSARINPEDALHISISAAVATGNLNLAEFIASYSENEVDRNAAFSAGAIMSQNNSWYSYIDCLSDSEIKGLPAQLRMQVIGSSGGTEKTKFEGYSLAASIIGKCKPCVNAHYNELKSMGYVTEQLRDIGRIAATINAISKIVR